MLNIDFLNEVDDSLNHHLSQSLLYRELGIHSASCIETNLGVEIVISPRCDEILLTNIAVSKHDDGFFHVMNYTNNASYTVKRSGLSKLLVQIISNDTENLKVWGDECKLAS